MLRNKAEMLVAEQGGFFEIHELNPGDFHRISERDMFQILQMREDGWVEVRAVETNVHNARAWLQHRWNDLAQPA